MPDAERFDFTLLHHALVAIHSHLVKVPSRREQNLPLTFCLDVGGVGTVTRTPRGILKYIHNPNAATIGFELRELVSRRIMWSGQLAPGDATGVYVPFQSGLDCTICGVSPGTAPNPVILAGDYDSNE